MQVRLLFISGSFEWGLGRSGGLAVAAGVEDELTEELAGGCVDYLFAAAITTAVIADGGPGWLNLVALTCVWNAMKFAWMAALNPVAAIRKRLRRARFPSQVGVGSN